MLSFAEFRKSIIYSKARKIVLSAGSTPLPRYISSISNLLSNNKYLNKPFSFVIPMYNGKPILSAEIKQIAENLNKDTEDLKEWQNYYSNQIKKEQQYLEKNIFLIEKKIEDIYKTALEIRSFSNKELNENKNLKYYIGFNNYDYIDIDNTNADIHFFSGKDNGTCTLPIDTERSIELDNGKFVIEQINISSNAKKLSSETNIFNNYFQYILPNDGSDTVTIDISLNNFKNEFNFISLKALCKAQIDIYYINQNAEAILIDSCNTTPNGNSFITFDLVSSNKIRLSIKNKQITPGLNGESIGIGHLKVGHVQYIEKAKLILDIPEKTNINGARIKVKSKVGNDSSLLCSYGFNGITNQKYITSSEEGIDLEVNNTDSKIILSETSSIYKSGNDWIIPNTTDVNKQKTNLYVGLNQWFVSYKDTNYELVDDVYPTLDLSSWNDYNENTYKSGIFTIGQDIEGDLDSPVTYIALTGSVTQSFILNNEYSYGDALSESLVFMLYDKNKEYVLPGKEYRVKTFIHCTEKKLFDLSVYFPGSSYTGGTAMFALYINKKLILGNTQSDINGVNSYLSKRITFSLDSGWNEVVILLYRPNTSLEQSPNNYSYVRFNFNPLKDSVKSYLNISKILAFKDPLQNIDLLTLKVNKYKGKRNCWSWELEDDISGIVLNDSWGNEDVNFFDGLSYGVGANFYLEMYKALPISKINIEFELTNKDNKTPEVYSVLVEPT